MTRQELQQAGADTAIVLGSGLGSVLEGFESLGHIELQQLGLPGSPHAVAGHAHRLHLCRAAGRPLLIAAGRRHLYEGISAAECTALVRCLHELGVRRLLLTNAAGAIRADLRPGSLMLIADHLNLQGSSPLDGAQFIDMSQAYCPQWRSALRAQAAQLGIPLPEGVYAALRGPQYETPAEVRMLRSLGADAVGMSTVLEVIQARALGMQVAAISMLANAAAGLNQQQLDHQDVLAQAAQASRPLQQLLLAHFNSTQGAANS